PSSQEKTPLSSQGKISLKISNLEINVEIKGKILGLDPSTYDKYKVILYTWRNDRWWIHPFKRGGPGKSYASINNDGTWSITAEKHMVGATQAAAFLVTKGLKPYDTVSGFKQIKYIARSKTWKVDNN
ncbi:MAG: hypothetical protein GY931_07210, partial [Maribacter sp.]|nr:hypothetical protein [Maribacter sp.]